MTCRFTHLQSTWVERQARWSVLLPVSLLLAAAACLRYASRHRLSAVDDPRRWGLSALRAVAYPIGVVGTVLATGFVMSISEPGLLIVLPLVLVPAMSVSAIDWLRRWVA